MMVVDGGVRGGASPIIIISARTVVNACIRVVMLSILPKDAQKLAAVYINHRRTRPGNRERRILYESYDTTRRRRVCVCV